MLIRDGAILVRSAADVVEHVGVNGIDVSPCDRVCEPVMSGTEQNPIAPKAPPRPAPPQKPHAPPKPLPDIAQLHSQILDRLIEGPMVEDQLLRTLNLAPTAVAPVLVDLELEGRVVRQPGGLLARAHDA